MRYPAIILVTTITTLLPAIALAQPSLKDQISAVAASDADQQGIEQAQATRAHAAALQAQRRNQAYADQLRNAKLQDTNLDLQVKKAKVARVNEYIDQDLKEHAATTDVIQSNADAMRNVTEGAKEEMKSNGRANERSAKGWLGW